ncbi:MAG: choice-of-anchor H family protein, partial [Pseudomonadota bacterium]
MSRRASDKEYRLTQTLITAVYVLLVAVLTVATASADDEIRTSTSHHYADAGASATSAPVTTEDSFSALQSEGQRSRSNDAAATSSGAPQVARAVSGDFWIYDADVLLFGDDDRDGFFFGIDLLFDADTIYSSARVYAVLYLSLNGGPWNEYAVTEDFRINGASSDDEYVVVTELQSGYPTGEYDLLIELFDANTGAFLADFGPESSSSLSFLALED